MRKQKGILAATVYIVLGVALLTLGIMETIDAFWSGMGSAMMAVGVIRLVQVYRYRKNETYRQKQELEKTDERNHFLRNKAWAWAGYLFVLITAVATVVLKLMGQDLLSIAAGFAICLMIILYWFSYLILRKKY